MAIYLDCNATTPLDPKVKKVMLHYINVDFGNAGSRTHEFGTRAKQAVQKARQQIADVVNAKPDEVYFTSGATESNNLSILGLEDYANETKKKHIISSQIEHKAVLEPLQMLSRRGFKVSLIKPNPGGWIEPIDIQKAIRDDTFLVSIMHVNNETGVVQPISDIASILEGSTVFFHVDAAQGFGKDIKPLQNKRIDLISISGHKIYGPKGIGALIVRRHNYKRLPLKPLMYGGGQEKGLRPGTLPVHLIAGLGTAAEIALKEVSKRENINSSFRKKLVQHLEALEFIYNGDQDKILPHVINISFPGLDSEAIIVALKDLIAISNGSACTSQNYEPSHVLKAMGLSDDLIKGAVRISWSHMTEEPNWEEIVEKVRQLY
jgi:cysteine desulfurase